MATPREYFEKDASRNLRFHRVNTFTDTRTNEATKAEAGVSFDFEAGAKYVLIYFPESRIADHIIIHYLENVQDVLKDADGMKVISGFHGTEEEICNHDLSFSGRVLVYTPCAFTAEARNALLETAKSKGLSLVLRDGPYHQQRAKADVPVAFICHDHRDKDPFVRELASTLQKMLFSVWYDEYSLRVGHSLRESIEKGLKECRKCILVLSPNFITNGGWTKAEFDTIYTREIVEQQKFILPVWHNISKEQIFDYSPRILDKVGISSSLGAEEVARKITRELQ